MKKSLTLYVLIVAVLFGVFTYSYLSKQLSHQKEVAEKKISSYKDSLAEIKNKMVDVNHFSLEQNDLAQNYLEKYNLKALEEKIKESLLNYNDVPEGNPYAGFEKINSNKFIINNFKILNHRWIIAETSNTQIWGEVLIQYFVEEDESITFEVLKALLYPNQ
ncbi:MAG: hypothetical protein ACK4RM_03065 [Flavobacterium sp.]